MNWAEYLKQFQKSYEEAEVDTYEEVPDGEYRVRVFAVRLKVSKNTGRPMLEWEFEILDGKFKGRHEWKYAFLDDAERIQWLKRDLFRAGLHLKDITKLEKELPNLLDRELQIEIVTKTGDNGNAYRNIYIKKLLSESPTNGAAKPVDPALDQPWIPKISDDDLPF